MFANTQVETENIPSITDLDLKSISEKYKIIIIINRLVVISVLVAITVFFEYFMKERGISSVFFYLRTALIAIAILSIIYALMAVRKRKYALRQHDIIYTKGVIIKTITTVPICRIQHIEESRSWIERHLGLASIKLYTAGNSGTDLSVRGLSLEEANQINTFISNRIDEEV